MSDLPPPPPFNLTPPPGYVAYGGPGAVPYGTQPIGGIAKPLGILMMILVPVELLSVINTISTSRSAKDFLNGSISESKFEDASQGSLVQIGGLLVIPVAVLTMIWMFRMAKNLRALGRTGATFAPGWAIGGWFTPPCVIYVVPWLMLKELWKGSDPELTTGDPNWKAGRVSPLITAWWVMYGLLPLVGFATAAGLISGLQDVDNRDLAEQIDKYATINIALGVVGIGTAIVYLMLVRQLSARHMKAIGET
ncbi:MAG: DUF4328 domain-containing protein [Actinomycetia bacterium]|nr:DUF4328 domain-containing protein [Actinomycetes bacterium]